MWLYFAAAPTKVDWTAATIQLNQLEDLVERCFSELITAIKDENADIGLIVDEKFDSSLAREMTILRVCREGVEFQNLTVPVAEQSLDDVNDELRAARATIEDDIGSLSVITRLLVGTKFFNTLNSVETAKFRLLDILKNSDARNSQLHLRQYISNIDTNVEPVESIYVVFSKSACKLNLLLKCETWRSTKSTRATYLQYFIEKIKKIRLALKT